jgi:glycosyltransferase involved in cell wall biosynthesis
VLTAELGLPRAPFVIYNAPSLRDAKPPPYDLRDRLGLDSATPLLVYTGSVTKNRRFQTLFEALSRLAGVHLAVISRHAAKLADAAHNLGVEARVHLLPPVAHDCLVSLTRSADVAVHPLDRYAGGDVAMPNKLFEYLHAGLPMIVSDSPQIARFVREHRLGEVAVVDDPGAWATAITRILDNRQAYGGYPDEHERLRQAWSWEAQEDILLDVYRRLTTASPRGVAMQAARS